MRQEGNPLELVMLNLKVRRLGLDFRPKPMELDLWMLLPQLDDLMLMRVGPVNSRVSLEEEAASPDHRNRR